MWNLNKLARALKSRLASRSNKVRPANFGDFQIEIELIDLPPPPKEVEEEEATPFQTSNITDYLRLFLLFTGKTEVIFEGKSN